MPTVEHTVYGQGVLCLSVCTSGTLEQVTEYVNAFHPTGTEAQWRKSEDSHFATGHCNPVACDEFPATHTHYLFEC